MVDPGVLYFTDTFPPQVNGVSVVAAASIDGLQRRGWRCGVVAPRYPKPYGKAFVADAPDLSAMEIHVKLPSIPFAPYPDIRIAAPLYADVRDAVRRFEPDLLHCQTEFIIGRLGQRAAREFSIPLVSSYHTDFSRYTESYRVSWARSRVTNYIARFHQRSSRVYTPSEHAREDLLKMAAMDVEVWGRSVDIDQFHPDRRSDELRASMGLEGHFTFLHVGRLAAEKNVALVIEAFQIAAARIREKHPLLIIAGSGPQTEELRRLAAGTPEIQFLGNLDRHGVLPALYASTDAFVYASETETLGLVILEAMASALPVIAAPVAGVGVNLRNMETGLAFLAGNAASLAHAMERMACDDELRRQLSAGGRQWAEVNDWEIELDRLDLSYREVILKARATPAEPLTRVL